MLTEGINPRTGDIDRLNALAIVRKINDEDKTVAQTIEAALPQIAQAVEGIVARLGVGGRMIYTGAGTSGRLGVLDAVECVPTFSVSPDTVQAIIAGGTIALTEAVEGAEDDHAAGGDDLKARGLTADDVVVGIAASGRTPYVLGAVAYARQIGALTVGVACNRPAPLLDAVEIPIPVPVGPEVITGSTRMKAGTAQKMVLNMLSTASMIQLGKVYGNLMVDVQVNNAKLAVRARTILQHITGLDEHTADDLLAKSGNRVKVAVVMHMLKIDAAAAESALAEQDGFLRRVVEGGES